MPRQIAGKDIPEITALRILAALCVVISHLHALGMVSAASFHEIFDGGRPAVCFFFVLSGFIMHHNYPLLDARDPVATRRYARSRVARLYPTLLLSLCMALPTVIYLVTAHSHDLLLQYYALKSHYAFWLVASAIAQLLVLTGWTPAAAINQPWNGPAWSLSCEFFFYTVFPFIRPVLQRLSSRRIIAAMIAAWLLQGIWIIALYALAAPNRSPFLAYQFPLTHFPEFMSGICVGILFRRFNRQQLNVLIGVTTVAALLAVGAVYASKINLPASYGQTPIFLALIVATVRSSGSRWLAPLRNRVVVALGHASYALYIIHVPILLGASVLGIAMPLGWFWLPFLLLASLLIHYGYAEPVRRWLLKQPKRLKARGAGEA
jgi:peptidoglycan/LPS O-acetylase OafA/YrhL